MALTLLAANNAQTVLAAGISSSATSITVNTGTGALFPAPVSGTSYFKLTLVDAATGSLTEIVHVTARTGDVMTIQRGQEGTSARAWSANDLAANMMTAGSFDALLQKQSNLGDLENPVTARTNLGFDAMGIGLSGNILQSLSSLDWQTFEFVTGALYVVQSGNMTNVPVGLDVPGPTYNTLIRVNGPEGGNRHVEVIYSTTSSANYRYYQVRVSGLLGSRTFSVRTIFTSANVIPTANLDAPGRLLGAPKVFVTSGSYTPGPNVKSIEVEIVGGGGGGGYAKASSNFNAAGGGGGAGGYSKKFIPITSQTPIPFTVGQGGTGAVVDAGSSGQAGGTTTFGTGFSATGGTGGNSAISVATSTSVGAGGTAGIGTGGDINARGGPGQAGVSEKPSIAGGTVGGGPGGSSIISGQGGPGGGGPGGSTTGNGNRGNDGIVIVREYS
ncbi:glycine-rich domain-containing protein [Atlantibacter hermannii]|uniref:glycine-rich domain-containing protein n=1 Tax=Atlantibacter hermannii TaxID=565 RepID=UPI0028A81CF6|nr:hypothetical protein [Atlantibacter hermannii]